jgi:putative membrane protein
MLNSSRAKRARRPWRSTSSVAVLSTHSPSEERPRETTRLGAREPLFLLIATALALAVSGWRPLDRTTWLLEVAPVFIGAAILAATYKGFPLTPLVYRLLFAHALLLLVGGHYTYARVPLGAWIQDLLDLARNPYDRFGHVAQGFVPALVAREVLLRTSPLERGRWLFALVTCVCLAISALYEFVEWGAASLLGHAAADFLGTQGDVWDTQWDMLCALAGSLTAQLALGSVHDRQLRELAVRADRSAPVARAAARA